MTACDTAWVFFWGKAVTACVVTNVQLLVRCPQRPTRRVTRHKTRVREQSERTRHQYRHFGYLQSRSVSSLLIVPEVFIPHAMSTPCQRTLVSSQTVSFENLVCITLMLLERGPRISHRRLWVVISSQLYVTSIAHVEDVGHDTLFGFICANK